MKLSQMEWSKRWRMDQMSKERLEEIKDNYKFAVFPQDVEFLIEQAERVPELESHLSKNGNKYRNQNKRLRKELDRVTRQRNKQQDKEIVNKMKIKLEEKKKQIHIEEQKKEIREKNLEGYKNLKNKQHKRIKELEEQNKRYREAMLKIRELTTYDAGTEEAVFMIADDIIMEVEESESEKET